MPDESSDEELPLRRKLKNSAKKNSPSDEVIKNFFCLFRRANFISNEIKTVLNITLKHCIKNNYMTLF